MEEVGTGTNCIEVSTDFRSLLELISTNLVFLFIEIHEPFAIILLEDAFSFLQSLFVSSVLAVRNSNPFLRTSDTKSHLGFERRLIKAGENTEAMKSFELSVKILLVVRGVNELV
jgi:hypothetical protein